MLPKNFFSFIYLFIFDKKKLFFLLCALSFIAGLWGPCNSYLLRYIINTMPLTQDFFFIFLGGFLIVLNFIVFDNVTWRGIQYIKSLLFPLLLSGMYRYVFSYMLDHDYQYYQERQLGELNKKIFNLILSVETILSTCLTHCLRMLSLLLVSFFFCIKINSIFFFILILWTIIFFIFSFFRSKKVIFFSEQYAKEESIIGGTFSDVLSNALTVNLSSSKEYELNFLNTILARFSEAYVNKELQFFYFHGIQGMLIALMIGVNSFLLIYLYKLNQIDIGDFTLVFKLSIEIGHMLWWTMDVVETFNREYARGCESFNFIFVPIRVKDKLNAKKLLIEKSTITFSDVNFSYHGNKKIFNNLSIEITSGEKIGLVGYSGAGKTTFVNLILRMYDIEKGKILIDQVNIADVTKKSLHELISIIPQEPLLFHRSLLENIQYGSFEKNEQAIIIAAKKAFAHDFIMKLPEQYKSLVGDRGIKLSGGQRQRIAIARAFLKNAPILILDEATSQLDSITEKLIQESLIELMVGKTTIIIAHRLSTLESVDRILVFDDGQIVEDGPHSRLIEQNGLYKKLWDSQVGGYIINDLNE